MSHQHEDDTQFEQIVARLRDEQRWPEPDQQPPARGPAPWPRPAPLDGSTPADRADDSERDSAGPAEDETRRAQGHDPADPMELPSQWRVPPDDSPSVLDEHDEGFTPPPPRPLPVGDLSFWGALGGIVGGLLWLAYLVFFDRYAREIWWALAVLATVGGFALLVMRQPRKRGQDWDDDVDGAQL